MRTRSVVDVYEGKIGYFNRPTGELPSTNRAKDSVTLADSVFLDEPGRVPGMRGTAVSAQLSPEQVVRKFFDCYTNGRPDDFDEVVAADYTDYGHTPPGRGPGGARDDYENAVKQTGGVIRYTIDALVADSEMVAAAWTGTLPSADEAKGLSLYRTSGGLLRSTRHALMGNIPS